MFKQETIKAIQELPKKVRMEISAAVQANMAGEAGACHDYDMFESEYGDVLPEEVINIFREIGGDERNHIIKEQAVIRLLSGIPAADDDIKEAIQVITDGID